MCTLTYTPHMHTHTHHNTRQMSVWYRQVLCGSLHWLVWVNEPWMFIESLNFYLGLGTLNISWCKNVRRGPEERCTAEVKNPEVSQRVEHKDHSCLNLPRVSCVTQGQLLSLWVFVTGCRRTCHSRLPVAWYRVKTWCSEELLSKNVVCLPFALIAVVGPFYLLTWETLFEKWVYMEKTFFHRNKCERIKWENTTKMSSV